MKHANSILGIGIVLVLIPTLGFPPTWNRFFIVVLGLCLCFMVVREKYGDKISARLLKHKKDISAKGGQPTSTYDQTPTV